MHNEDIYFSLGMNDIVREIIREQEEEDRIRREQTDFHFHALEKYLKQYLEDTSTDSPRDARAKSIEDHRFKQFPTHRL